MKGTKHAFFALVLVALFLPACGSDQGADVPADSPGSGDVDRDGSRATTPDVGGEGLGERVDVPGGSFARVSPTVLEGMLENEDFVFVNTHVPYEGDIPGTDLSVPYDEIGREENLDRLPGKDARIVLYCKSGRMSVEAARTLVALGYSDVLDLSGGMIAWQEAGLPLEGT